MNNIHSVFNLARHLENNLTNIFPSPSEWITHSVKVVKNFSLPGQQNRIIGLALFIVGNALIFNLSHRMANAIPLESYRFLYDGIITGVSILVCNIALSRLTQYPLSNLTLGLLTATAIALRIFMDYYQSTATHEKDKKIEEKVKTKVKDLKNVKETKEEKAKLIEVEKQKKLEAEKKAKLKVEQASETAKKLQEAEEEKAKKEKIEAENLKKAKEGEAAEKEDKLKAQQESEAARKTRETEEEKTKNTQVEVETQNLKPTEEEAKKLVEVDKKKVVEAAEARLKAQQDPQAPKKDQEAEEDKTNNAKLECKGLIKVIEAKEEVDKAKLAEAAEARLKIQQNPETSKKAPDAEDLTKTKEEEEAKKLVESEKTKRVAALETRLKAENDAKAARQAQEAEERAQVVRLEREEQEKKLKRIEQIQETQKLKKAEAEKMVPPPFEFAIIKKANSTDQTRILMTCQNNADLQKLYKKFKHGTSTFASCVFDKVGSQSITTGATQVIVRLSSESQNQNEIEQNKIEQNILTYLNQLSGTLCPEIADEEIIPQDEDIIPKNEQSIK